MSEAIESDLIHGARDLERIRALAEVLRSILRAALAGALAGTVVLWLGGRVVMRLAAALNPQATGLGTQNGNVIGAVTLEGTAALLLFGGLLPGLAGSVVWTTVGPWIPGSGVRRALLTAPIAVALAGFFLVESDNPDFVVLTEDLVIVAMLLGLVAAFGSCLSLLDERLDQAMPRPGPNPREYALVAGFLVLCGAVLILPITIGFYFSAPACLCDVAPLPLAVPLLVAGGATVAWWVQRALGRTHPSAPVRLVGRLGLLTAVGLGAALVATEVGSIPS